VSVTNILETVRQGRQRLAQPGLYSELASLPEAGSALGNEPTPLPRRSTSQESADSFALGTGTDQAVDWNPPPRWDAQRDSDALPQWGSKSDAAGPAEGSDLLVDSARPGGNSEIAQGAATTEAFGGWTPRPPGDPGAFNGGDPTATGQSASDEPAAAGAGAAAAEGEQTVSEGEQTVSEAEPAVSEGEPAASGAGSAVSEGEPASGAEPATEVEQPGEEVAAERPRGDADQPRADAEGQPEERDETAAEPRPQEARAE
jgi:hypothetical protein